MLQKQLLEFTYKRSRKRKRLCKLGYMNARARGKLMKMQQITGRKFAGYESPAVKPPTPTGREFIS